MLTKTLSVTLLLFIVGLSQAQSHIANIKRFGPSEGLSGRGANYILEDSRGLVWFATQSGIDRFDGRNFEVFNTAQNGLLQNNIQKIAEDQAGWLWLQPGWKDGKSVYPDWSLVNVYSNEVVSLRTRLGKKLLVRPDEISQMLASPDRTLFFADFKNEIYRYRPKEGFQKIWANDPSATELKLLGADDFSRLYICQTLGNQGKKLILLGSDGQKIREWYFAATDKLAWVATQKQTTWLTLANRDAQVELWAFFPDGGKNLQFTWQESEYRYLTASMPQIALCPQKGVLWVLWKKKLLAYDIATGLLLNDFLAEYRLLRDLSDLREIYLKKNGDAWLATTIEGVARISLKTNPFQNYFTLNEQKTDNRIIFSCRGIWSGLNRIFVSTYQGTFYLNKGESIPRQVDVPLYNYSILCHPDGKQNLWLSDRRGFIKVDPASVNTQRYALNLAGLGYNEVNCIKKDTGQAFWFGSEGGVGWFDPQTNQIRRFEQVNGHDTLHHSIVYAIQTDAAGGNWFCTNTGLYLSKEGRGVVAHYGLRETGSGHLPSDLISHACFDADGSIWLASLDVGLIHFNPQSSTPPEVFGLSNGLTSNVLHAVYSDEYNNLWLSSERGIIKFDKERKSAKAFLPPDGTAEYEYNRHSHFKADDGTLFFGSINGLTAFNPNKLAQIFQDSTPGLPILVTHFSVFNARKASWEDRTAQLVNTGQIYLEDQNRYFSLQLSLPESPENNNVAYEYRIDGLDNAWTAVSDNVIRVYRLAYGRYTFQIRCRLANGTYSSAILDIPLTNMPPWYLRTWFLLLAFALLVAGIWFYFRRKAYEARQNERLLQQLVTERTQTIAAQTDQIRQDKELIELQARELQELNEVKSKFFANVSHELRTPLALIAGPINKILKKNKLDKEDLNLLHLAQKSSADLQELVDDILDLIKLDSGTVGLQLEQVEVKSMLENLTQKFHALAAYREIRFKVNYLAGHELKTQIDAKKFGQILNNLVANAFKFTPKQGTITISFSHKNKQFTLEVADTGSGIHPNDIPHIFDRFYQSSIQKSANAGGAGIGLSLCREYAALFGGSLSVESTLEKGSIFRFVFPEKTESANLSSKIPPLQNSLVVNGGKPEMIQAAKFPNENETIKPLILIVEDNHGLRNFIRLILEPVFEIIEAENGKDALALLRSKAGGQTQLIITDLMMPIMDGFQFIDQVKADDKFKQIPVIVLTARATLEDRLHALRIGVDDYIIKPFEEEELMAQARALLQNKAARGNVELSEQNTGENLKDTAWLAQFEQVVKTNIAKHDLTAEDLARFMATSRTVLFTEVKRLTGLTLNEYIREVRFQEVRMLLETGKCTSVKEAIGSVGIRQAKHFSQQFQERFGKKPSDFLTKAGRSGPVML